MLARPTELIADTAKSGEKKRVSFGLTLPMKGKGDRPSVNEALSVVGS
jgi:hypothetical protein